MGPAFAACAQIIALKLLPDQLQCQDTIDNREIVSIVRFPFVRRRLTRNIRKQKRHFGGPGSMVALTPIGDHDSD